MNNSKIRPKYMAPMNTGTSSSRKNIIVVATFSYVQISPQGHLVKALLPRCQGIRHDALGDTEHKESGYYSFESDLAVIYRLHDVDEYLPGRYNDDISSHHARNNVGI